ncbi:MAG: hypothetical protein JWQ39_2487 [Glaciihabitans sp.]|jgi:uncharacterized membrane protein|nr:hypothetical protein [Glaciihabitans sp.]
MSSDQTPKRQPEHRFTVGIAILIALVGYLFLPQRVQPLPVWIVPAVGILMFVPLVILNPRRLVKERAWSRWMAIALAVVLTVVNQVTVIYVIRDLIAGNITGTDVLLTAAVVWGLNVIAFSLVYWELDLGGPFKRRVQDTRETRDMDFRFPQHDGAPGNKYWEPEFFDYFYFSLSNQMAFSATDVMPMTKRAKALMGYQALTGFVLLALVISRAVNILH